MRLKPLGDRILVKRIEEEDLCCKYFIDSDDL